MKIQIISKPSFIVLPLLLHFTVNSQAPSFPPAQGPPQGSGVVVLPIYFSNVYTILDNYLRDTILPPMNENLRQKSLVPVRASHSIKQLMPKMNHTTYKDKPNEKYAVIPYEISYKLNITGFPDRYLKQHIKIMAFCKNWSATGGGSIKVSVVAENPQLVGESISEKIIDFFTLGKLTKFINNKINENLPGIIVRPLFDADIACNCLTLDPGESPIYEGSVKYYYKPPPIKAVQVQDGYRVSIKKIKKLSPTTLQGSPLFDNPENFQVRYYVNQKSESSSISGIQPGQERNFPKNDFFIPKPSQDGKIVIIVAIDMGGGTNAGHIVLDESTNFGFGLKKLFIQRSYRTDPITLPNGTIVKGAEVKANAYEITIEIKRVNPNLSGKLRN